MICDDKERCKELGLCKIEYYVTIGKFASNTKSDSFFNSMYDDLFKSSTSSKSSSSLSDDNDDYDDL